MPLRITCRKKPILRKSCERETLLCADVCFLCEWNNNPTLQHFTAETTVRIPYLKDNLWLAVIMPIAERMDTKPQPVQNAPHLVGVLHQKQPRVVWLFLNFCLSYAALLFLSHMDSNKLAVPPWYIVTEIWCKCLLMWYTLI